MEPGISPEQQRGLEPGQPVPPDTTGRGRERFDLGRAIKWGAIIFATSFVLLEGGLLVSSGGSGAQMLDQIPQITAAALELSTIFSVIGGLTVGEVRPIG